jgi:hypothetical protein
MDTIDNIKMVMIAPFYGLSEYIDKISAIRIYKHPIVPLYKWVAKKDSTKTKKILVNGYLSVDLNIKPNVLKKQLVEIFKNNMHFIDYDFFEEKLRLRFELDEKLLNGGLIE